MWYEKANISNDIKGRAQVATENVVSCLWQQPKLNVKTRAPNFRRVLLNR